MHVGNHNPWFSYTINETSSTEHNLDLGLVFDDVLKYVSTIVLKANRTLGIIKKCFTQSTLLVLYKHLVRIQNTVILFRTTAT